MRVFVTGGTGLIGSTVVAELLGNGHTVLVLARSASSATALRTVGAETIRGDLAVIRVIEDQITTLRPYNARYTGDPRSIFRKRYTEMITRISLDRELQLGLRSDLV
jgi:nucleoside-diphosphate-sugar epimerase